MEICLLGVKHIFIGRLSSEHLCSDRDKADSSCDSTLSCWQAVGTKQKQRAKLLNSPYANNEEYVNDFQEEN